MLSVVLAIVGVFIGFGGSTVITKNRMGSAEAKAEKELERAQRY